MHGELDKEIYVQQGLLGLIFTRSQNKCQDPAKLRRLTVDLIDKGEAHRAERVSMSADVKGDAYEGLLEAAPAHPCARGIRAYCSSKNAQGTKSGDGGRSVSRNCQGELHT